ncbi:MAG: hypothetical protein DWQ19_11015 [Crenarchaeota archaeon]|nr:MAG: hypothetical protein DWQ19_11015 [Thermoproteota archaeon]
MKIYIVTNGTYSDYSIKAVFTDKEKAYKYLEDVKLVHGDDNAQVEEWEADQETEKIPRQYWISIIYLPTGEITEQDTSGRYCFAKPNDRVVESTWKATFNGNGDFNDIKEWMGTIRSEDYWPNTVKVQSLVSQEHANKLAAEARQNWLRYLDSIGMTMKPTGKSWPEYHYVSSEGESKN